MEEVIAFLGLGLISGSLAGALRAAGWRGELIAWGPRAPSLERGVELGVIDRFTLDLAAAISDADVVVIGAPPRLPPRCYRRFWHWPSKMANRSLPIWPVSKGS